MRYSLHPQKQSPVQHGLAVLTASLLWVFAIFGVVVVTWLGFSAVSGAQLIFFKTGSMAPSLPVGSLAVTIPTQASELEPGDVVTVQRELSTLPVTHRIVDIEPVNTLAEIPTYVATLKGDANQQEDFEPYFLTVEHKVILGLPHAGTVLGVLQTPQTMLSLTAVAAFLMGYAFWPERTTREYRHGGFRKKDPSSAHYRQSIVALSILALAAPPVFLFAGESSAESLNNDANWVDYPENGEEDYLTLSHSVSTQLMMSDAVKAGDEVQWHFRASIRPPEENIPDEATLSLVLRAEGSMIQTPGITILVKTCEHAFVGDEKDLCPNISKASNIEKLFHAEDLKNADPESAYFGPTPSLRLGEITGTTPIFVYTKISIPSTMETQDTSARIGFGFTAEQSTLPPETQLSDSGFGTKTPFLLITVAIIAGISFIVLASRSRKRGQQDVGRYP